MPDQIAPQPVPEKREPRPVDADLSSEIEKVMDRQPQDRIRCVRLYGNYYRCNWWAPTADSTPGMLAHDWYLLASRGVRKSQFLRVTREAGRLVIVESTRR